MRIRQNKSMLSEKYFINKFTTEKGLLTISFLLISLVYLPYLILGQNIYFPIHDNMDSNIIWAKMVSDAGGIFSSPNLIINQIMDGIHRSGVYGLYDLGLLMVDVFGPFWGYVICKYLMALGGFFGMYLLLKKYVLSPDSPVFFAIGVGLLFGLLPFWSFTATVAWSPLALYALLNLRQKEKYISNWILLFAYAFFSSLILIGFFILLAFAIIWIIDVIRFRSVNWYLFSGLVFLSLSYILSHFPLFSILIYDPNFETVRSSFVNMEITAGKAFSSALSHVIIDDGNGEFWAFTISLQKFIIIPICLLAGVILIINKEINRHYIYLILFIVFSSFFAAFYLWGKLAFIHEILAQFIPINLRRIYWLTPACWYALFCLSLCIIHKQLKKKGTMIATIAFFLQFLVVVTHQEYIPYEGSGRIPYNRFYSEKQFSDIRNHIGKDVRSYRVVSLGIHPAISQYNRFYTVDGYSTNYPLPYKTKFRRIIAGELNKSPSTAVEYDKWGSWCYTFFGEQGFMQILSNTNDYPKIQNLDYDFDTLKEMGGEYLLSAAEIETNSNPRLEFIKAFDNYQDSSNWNIYLYKVK